MSNFPFLLMYLFSILGLSFKAGVLKASYINNWWGVLYKNADSWAMPLEILIHWWEVGALRIYF